MNRFALMAGLLGAACSLGADPAPTAQDQIVARMQGEWRISLTEQQRRQVRTMRFLTRVPPPTNDELAQFKLTESESKAAIIILNEIRYDPHGERTQQLRTAIDHLEQGELSIGPTRLEVRLGDVKKAGRYEVGATTGTTAHLRLLRDDGKEESVALSLTPQHELVFGEGADSVMFVKR
ncbi:MAG: hypothetical protein CL927_00910 [Deltaproteobacteria bacterium]|nr:hypothetical protein [Deltaproteobacteria bacterium]